MPRTRKTPTTPELVDQTLPGLDPDPAPAAARARTPRKSTGRPVGRPRKSTTAGPMTKAQMIDKVSTELYAYASMAVGMWSFRDPDCAAIVTEDVIVPSPSGPVQTERLRELVARVVAIMARNDRVLRAVAETGMVGEILMALHLAYPIGAALWRAHGPGGVGHRNAAEVERDYAEHYPAPALA